MNPDVWEHVEYLAFSVFDTNMSVMLEELVILGIKQIEDTQVGTFKLYEGGSNGRV